MSAFFILLTLVLLWFLWRVKLYYQKKHEYNRALEKSLEDESLYVEGLGKVNFDDLGEEVTKANPDDYIQKKLKNSITELSDEELRGEHYLIKDLPLVEERILYLEQAFAFLSKAFNPALLNKPVLTQHSGTLPHKINEVNEIIPLAQQIARIMDLDLNQLEITFFEAGIRYFDEKTGDYVYWDKEDYAGLYHGKNEEGKYLVSISDDIHQDTDMLIGTIAHEFSHIKLLGEERLEENNEDLTDLLPLFYGLGIYVANSCFKLETGAPGWRLSTSGYLRQADWGYLFALYLKARNEHQPEWLEELNKTVVKYCERATEHLHKL